MNNIMDHFGHSETEKKKVSKAILNCISMYKSLEYTPILEKFIQEFIIITVAFNY